MARSRSISSAIGRASWVGAYKTKDAAGVGKQTLSALQREPDARRKSKQGGAGAAGGAAVAGGNEAVTSAPTVEPSIIGDPLITAGGIAIAAIAFLFLAYLAWHYRDLIAAGVQGFAPRLAGWLRSF
jgi:lysozyme